MFSIKKHLKKVSYILAVLIGLVSTSFVVYKDQKQYRVINGDDGLRFIDRASADSPHSDSDGDSPGDTSGDTTGDSSDEYT